MTWSDLPIHPTNRTLRQFAGLCLVVFGALGAWQYLVRQNGLAAAIFVGLAAAIGPLGLVRPSAIRPIFVAWMVVVFPIGWAVSSIVMAVLFYGFITPIGLGFRLTRRDPLGLRPNPVCETYWTPKPQVTDLNRYFQQF